MQWSPRSSRLAFLWVGALLAVAPLTAQEEEEVEDRQSALAFGGEPTTASVSGRLVLESGAPPPDPARVELLCSDQLLGQAFDVVLSAISEPIALHLESVNARNEAVTGIEIPTSPRIESSLWFQSDPSPRTWLSA